ncbi:MAG: ABC transporter permease [Bifidobacteriaceae bacterium]|jgi:ABC-2 type transport system permease protein|nr:ABC transporter permease [Bifidobacteriaceae bacterium]
MTAIASPMPSQQYRSAVGHDLTMGGIVKSEWVKLRSLRSTWWCGGLIFALTFGFGLLVALGLMERRRQELAEGLVSGMTAPDFTVLTANNGLTMLGQMVAVVFGALAVTGEYSSGSIRSTLAAAPRRGQVLVAKVIATLVFTALVGTVSIVATSAAIAALLEAAGQSNGIGPDAFALGAGGVYYLVVSALIGIGLGFILRSGAGAIAAGIALLFVVPMVLAFGSGNEVIAYILELTPWQASQLMTAVAPSEVAQIGSGEWVLGGYWGGAACLAAWAAAALIPARIIFRRRDA